MYSVAREWNPKQKQLAQLLAKPDAFADAMQVCLSLHNAVHDLEKAQSLTIYQCVLDGLTPEMMRYRPKGSPASIAWNLWHLARIEDAVVSILIADTAQELLNYRKAVGLNTRLVLNNIEAGELKRKPSKKQLDRLISEKVVTQEKDSIWLAEFWAKKTIAGLLTMPITRHQIVHINDCLKLKEKYRRAFA